MPFRPRDSKSKDPSLRLAGEALSDQEMLDYLRSNPDFFQRHATAIAELSLSHESGKAVSLIEHQVAILRDGQLIQQGTAQQIVLKPADDYISSFVRDVNRGRVIRCKTLMTPGEGVDGPTVDASLVIEEAARIMSAEGKETANVVNSKGKLMGIITMSDIIGAMVPPQVDAISVI